MFKKILFFLMVAGASLAGAREPLVQPATKTVTKQQEIINRYAAAKADMDLLMAPVKSERSLQSYMAKTRSEKNPLDALDEDARQEFLDSLTFNETGLTSYNYQILVENLTPKQAKGVLALFGSQDDLRYFSAARSAPAPGAENSMYCELVPEADDVCVIGDGGGWGGGGWGDGPIGGGGGGGGDLQSYPNMRCEGPGRCVYSSGSRCSARC
jgi:hypothetical protein